jgi:hypothetical protein
MRTRWTLMMCHLICSMPTWKRVVVRMSHEDDAKRKRTLICTEIEDIFFMKPSESVSLDLQPAMIKSGKIINWQRTEDKFRRIFRIPSDPHNKITPRPVCR